MNEELQENAREMELELREERDNALVRLSEVSWHDCSMLLPPFLKKNLF
jgi:hypothetical protein